MATFFTTLWISLMSFFGLVPELEIHQVEQVQIEKAPTGTPGQSAPAESITACIGKAVEQSCSFEINQQKLQGICKPSGEELACTPIIPK